MRQIKSYMMARVVTSLALAWGLFYGFNLVHATTARLDLEQHQLLIDKLNAAREGLGRSTPEFNKISIRLADLHSDRARLLVIEGNESGAKADRLKALNLYRETVLRLHGTERVRVLLQRGFLEQNLGQTKAALNTFHRAHKESRGLDREHQVQTLAARGEFLFTQKKFKLAAEDFNAALKLNPSAPHAGLWTYRLAWCELNQGQYHRATHRLKKLLGQPDLMIKLDAEGKAHFDEAFHSDALDDLVIFLSRGRVTDSVINEVLEMSPESKRRSQLERLAKELERLGKKNEATLAWARLELEGDPSKSDSLAQKIHTAQLKWDMGRKEEALEDYKGALDQWSSKVCGDAAQCDDLRKRLKNFIIVWNKTEKEKPSSRVIEAYGAYLTKFSDDSEMLFQAGEAASKGGYHKEASDFFIRAAQTAPENQKIRDSSLGRAIEEIEKTKNLDDRIQVYSHYLELEPQGQLSTQVKYQRAYMLYQKKDWTASLAGFTEIADSPIAKGPNRSLQVQAADLALDILAIKNNDQEILQKSSNWSEKFKERASDYRKLQRLAIVRITSATLQNTQADSSDLKAGLRLMDKAPIAQASPKEVRDLRLNELALATRLQERSRIRQAAANLLKVKNLTAQDQELALSHLEWMDELELKFSSAYATAIKMRWPRLNATERELKLALLASLAQRDPNRHYARALRSSRSKGQERLIRATLVRRSKQPWSELRRQKPFLRGQTEILAGLTLESFDQTGNLNEAEKMASSKELRQVPALAIFRRQGWLSSFRTMNSKVSYHRLISHSDRLLKASLRERIRLLDQVEKLGVVAQQQSFVVGQYLVGRVLAKENERIYSDILKLPVPRQLKGKDRSRFERLLLAQAEPFHRKSLSLEKQTDLLIADSEIFDRLEQAVAQSSNPMRDLLSKEWRLVASNSNSHLKRKIESILNTKTSSISTADYDLLRNQIRNDPFSIQNLDKFRKAAELRKDHILIAYLDARKSIIQKGGLQ